MNKLHIKLSGLAMAVAAVASVSLGAAAQATDGIDYSSATQPFYKDECKQGGWIYYVDDNHEPFKNQGQCVAYTVPFRLPPVLEI